MSRDLPGHKALLDHKAQKEIKATQEDQGCEDQRVQGDHEVNLVLLHIVVAQNILKSAHVRLYIGTECTD